MGVLPGIHGFWLHSYGLSLDVAEANPLPEQAQPPIAALEVRVSPLCCQLLGLCLMDRAEDGDVTGIGLPHPGMLGIIHILKVSLLHPPVLGTKSVGLRGFLVVISLLEPGGEGVEGPSKSLAIWILVLGPFSTLYFILGVLVLHLVAIVGIPSNDYHPLLMLLKYCSFGQLLTC